MVQRSRNIYSGTATPIESSRSIYIICVKRGAFVKIHSYYLLQPLDWEFCFMEVDEYKALLEKNYMKDEASNKHFAGELSELFCKIDEILALAMSELRKTLGFSQFDNSGLRCPPLIFPIPHSYDSGIATFGIVLKLDSDGDTFVFSPVPLAHLEDYCDK